MANIADSRKRFGEQRDRHTGAVGFFGGRAVTAWQTDALSVSDINVTSAYDAPAVLLESWARNTSINNVTMNWNYTGTPADAVFHFTGSSYGTYVNNVTINNVGSILLVGSGTQPAQHTPLGASRCRAR